MILITPKIDLPHSICINTPPTFGFLHLKTTGAIGKNFVIAPLKTRMTMEAVAIKEIQSQHFEHKVWMNQLGFYADEVKIYENQLETLVRKNIREMLPKLEHFQNNFIRQKEVLDQLVHDIRAHEHELVVAVNNDQELSEASKMAHDKYREEVEIFLKIYADLKADFLRFWRKWH